MRASSLFSFAVLFLAATVCLLAVVNFYRAHTRHASVVPAPAESAPGEETQQQPVGVGPPSRLTVEVTGRDFAWYYRLPGNDGRFDTGDDIRVRDELHLPRDIDVELLVKSSDFVYTLSIPELELRKIAIPELVYTLQFHTTECGTFEVVADPLCGVRLFHDENMGRLVIESRTEFEKWYGLVQ